jgi:hypothetical protein
MPILDVEALLESLPAEARATVAWAERPIEDGLARLRTQPLTEELLADVAAEVCRPIEAIAQAGLKAASTAQGESRDTLMDRFQQDENLLSAFLHDEDARDTLRWVVGLLRSFFDASFHALAPLPSESLARVGAEAARQAAAEPEIKPVIRGIVAFTAALREAKDRGDPERVAELLNVSFLQLKDLLKLMRRNGVSMSTFPDETIEDRHRRLLESAARLRKSLTDDDWRVLDEARVHNLR